MPDSPMPDQQPSAAVPDRQKMVLRDHASRLRSSLTDAERHELSDRIKPHLLELIAAREGVQSVGLYAAMAGEIDVDGLVDPLLAAGLVVAYPHVIDKTVMVFRAVEAPPKRPRGTLSIREPAGDRPVVDDLDLAVVPGLAFDRQGGRVGHGAGYYDRWLAQRPQTFTIGVCPEQLLVDRIPVRPHDVSMAAVVTQAGVYR